MTTKLSNLDDIPFWKVVKADRWFDFDLVASGEPSYTKPERRKLRGDCYGLLAGGSGALGR